MRSPKSPFESIEPVHVAFSLLRRELPEIRIHSDIETIRNVIKSIVYDNKIFDGKNLGRSVTKILELPWSHQSF